MKKIMVVLTLSILALSCGTEEAVTEFAPQDNLVSNAPLKQKVMRMAQNPTAIDNIIDACDCFSIKIPYVVNVNATAVQINSTADYAQVQAILDANDYDIDSIELMYPVTVTYADYSEETFTTAFYFFNAVASCTGTPELACIDLTYPVGIKTYDSQNVLAESFELGTKKALYEFLSSVEAYDAAAFTYPLQFITPDNTTISVTSNQVLEQNIDSNAAVCETQYYEPDPLLMDVIMQGTWRVTFFYNEGDFTPDYDGYNFMFNTDFTITVSGNGPNTIGFWDNYAMFADQQLNMYVFQDTQLINLEQPWIATSVSADQIEFFTASNGIDPQKYLQLTRN